MDKKKKMYTHTRGRGFIVRITTVKVFAQDAACNRARVYKRTAYDKWRRRRGCGTKVERDDLIRAAVCYLFIHVRI